MKKALILFLLTVITSGVGYSQNVTQSDISNSERGRLVLEHKKDKEGLASLDEVILIKDSVVETVFNSAGRFIQNVLEEDLDGNGIPELLIQMDLGGSGAFKEFALMLYSEGNYKAIWEETGFAGGEAEFADRENDGQMKLYIDYTDTDKKPAKKVTAVYRLENGELKQINSEDGK